MGWRKSLEEGRRGEETGQEGGNLRDKRLEEKSQGGKTGNR